MGGHLIWIWEVLAGGVVWHEIVAWTYKIHLLCLGDKFCPCGFFSGGELVAMGIGTELVMIGLLPTRIFNSPGSNSAFLTVMPKPASSNACRIKKPVLTKAFELNEINGTKILIPENGGSFVGKILTENRAFFRFDPPSISFGHNCVANCRLLGSRDRIANSQGFCRRCCCYCV